ncbi:MAG: D-lyxose/D-mannose family sugar isomerase [Christensenellales bacterium]
MKRSQINSALIWAMELIKKYGVSLPLYAYWTADEWRKNNDLTDTIRKVMLGWDITDYGLNDFEKIGGVLFTIRNGDPNDSSAGVPYAEKLIMLKDGQGLPTHFHFNKTEDIINRAGGVIAVKLYNSLNDYGIDYNSPVEVYCDGIKNTVKPGETVYITPGNSITLKPFMYHCFSAAKGEGDLICGEVSSVNDDRTDNFFYDKLPRFGAIDEDAPPLMPLCNEYDKWISQII